MDIDKIIENSLWEKDRKENLTPQTSDEVFRKISSKVCVKRKWYERLLIKINSKSKYAVDFAAIALAVLIIIMVPVIILSYKASHGNVPSSNKNSNIIKNNQNQNNTNNTNDKQIPNSDENQPPQNVMDKVEKTAKSRFEKYTIYYKGESVVKDYGDNKQYQFEVYENRTDTQTPQVDYYYVDSVTMELKEDNNNKTTNKYLLPSDTIIEIICKVEGYNNSQVSIALSEDPNIYQYQDKNTNNIIYYEYDSSGGQLFKEDSNRKNRQQIYKYNPNAYSPLTDEKNVDLNGDGKNENIKIDKVRGVLTIDKVSVAFNWFMSVNDDIAKLNDKNTEVYIVCGEDNDVPCSFFNYKEGLIYKNGEVNFGDKLIANGDNKIIIKNQIQQFFESWERDVELTLNAKGNLVESKSDLYKIPANTKGGTGKYQMIKVKTPVTIYKNKNSSEVAAKLKTGENVYVIGTDEKAWVLLQDESGTQGWIELKDRFIIKELNKYSGDVFEGLNFAG